LLKWKSISLMGLMRSIRFFVMVFLVISMRLVCHGLRNLRLIIQECRTSFMADIE
jgi:hypothetical protein